MHCATIRIGDLECCQLMRVQVLHAAKLVARLYWETTWKVFIHCGEVELMMKNIPYGGKLYNRGGLGEHYIRLRRVGRKSEIHLR